MSTHTDTERLTLDPTTCSDDRDQSCPVCNHLRKHAPAATHPTIIPARIGGWVAWSTTLVGLLCNLASEPTRVVIIEQPHRNERYLQMLIGHGRAYVEASSNEFLSGASALSGVEERLLTLLGWSAPHSGTGTESPNWSLPLVDGDWQNLVETVTATLVGIFGFSEQLPVEFSIFGADHPCRDCSWPDDAADEVDEVDDLYGTLGF